MAGGSSRRSRGTALLRKMSGQMPHGGGVRIQRTVRRLRDRPGLDRRRHAPRIAQRSGRPVGPRRAARAPALAMRELQQLRVIARYTDGREGDVTAHARFQSNNESRGRRAAQRPGAPSATCPATWRSWPATWTRSTFSAPWCRAPKLIAALPRRARKQLHRPPGLRASCGSSTSCRPDAGRRCRVPAPRLPRRDRHAAHRRARPGGSWPTAGPTAAPAWSMTLLERPGVRRLLGLASGPTCCAWIGRRWGTSGRYAYYRWIRDSMASQQAARSVCPRGAHGRRAARARWARPASTRW